MNILAFVFAILFILAYGATASLHKHVVSRKLEGTFVGLRKAERSLLRQSELKQFRETPGIAVKLPKTAKTAVKQKKERPLYIPAINPSCARLNLFPIIEEGKEVHAARYQMAAKILRVFYHTELFGHEKGLEYRILDHILSAAKAQLKEQGELPLETLCLKEAELQPLYYLLLKGNTKVDLFTSTGYPALVDYFKIERTDSPICLFHAHPHMLVPFFGLKTTPNLYQKLHQEVKGGIDLEALLLLAGDPQLAFVDTDVWQLFDLNRPHHKGFNVETLIAEDKNSGISIRKKIGKLGT